MNKYKERYKVGNPRTKRPGGPAELRKRYEHSPCL